MFFMYFIFSTVLEFVIMEFVCDEGGFATQSNLFLIAHQDNNVKVLLR